MHNKCAVCLLHTVCIEPKQKRNSMKRHQTVQSLKLHVWCCTWVSWWTKPEYNRDCWNSIFNCIQPQDWASCCSCIWTWAQKCQSLKYKINQCTVWVNPNLVLGSSVVLYVTGLISTNITTYKNILSSFVTLNHAQIKPWNQIIE